MARAARWGLSLGLLLVNLACGKAQSPADGGVAPDATAGAFVEIGTGIVQFEPLNPDGPTELIPGPQGGGRFEGHHIWTTIRLVGVAPFELQTYGVQVIDSDGASAAEFVREAPTAPFEQDEEGRWFLSGLAPRLADCCLVAGRAFTLVGTVRFANGAELTDRATGLAGECSVPCP